METLDALQSFFRDFVWIMFVVIVLLTFVACKMDDISSEMKKIRQIEEMKFNSRHN